jgi:hypothetical protein
MPICTDERDDNNLEIRYIMLDADGEPVEKYHQDDESDVCESSTVDGLLSIVAGRVFDFGSDDLREAMKPGGEAEGYRVICQEIRSLELECLDELDALKRG